MCGLDEDFDEARSHGPSIVEGFGFGFDGLRGRCREGGQASWLTDFLVQDLISFIL